MIDTEAKQVTRVSFDHALGLLFEDNSQLRIEGEFSVRGLTVDEVPAAGAIDASTQTVSRAAIAVLVMLHQTARVSLDGLDLVVTSEAGGSLVVGPDDTYEAWTYIDCDGAMFTLAPGGEIARFGAAD